MKIKMIAAACALFLASAAGAGGFGADRHVSKGIPCTACHGPDQKIEYPDRTQCEQCHSVAALKEKTKQLEPNPHNAPHNDECTLCHLQHEEPVNYCNQCHEFKYNVK